MPEITGVPKELMSFLQDRFAALEAKMDARFDEIDMSIKALSIRIEDTHKAVRKLRRSVNADDKADKASSSGSLHKASSDPAHPKIRSKHVRIQFAFGVECSSPSSSRRLKILTQS